MSLYFLSLRFKKDFGRSQKAAEVSFLTQGHQKYLQF